MIQYISTRGSKTKTSATQAIIRGLAQDKGLFMPTTIPKLPFALKNRIGESYQRIATDIIHCFFPDFSRSEIEYCVLNAYDDKFASEEIVPLHPVGQAHFLELYHGKTAAFKDMALSILPYLLTTATKKEGEKSKIAILTATSGDTGKAALEGFADVEGTEILVFYPDKGVSKMQQKQMVTQEGNNVHVYAIEGNFDDAQTGVKKIFNDEGFARELEEKGIKLSSANSINIGRLVPQVAYYIYGYLRLLEQRQIQLGQEINIVVPTGNFGNILAAYLAGQMGIPIGRYICASNENKVLTDFIDSGIYSTDRPFHLTNSPSMDILISSNLERLLFLLAQQDGTCVKELMEQLEQSGEYRLNENMKNGLGDFYGGFADEKQTRETIARLYRDHGYLVDTHTAVAYHVYDEYIKETGDTKPTLIASTASAYKFADSVNASIGANTQGDAQEQVKALHQKTGVTIPRGLANLDQKPVLHKDCIRADEMKATVNQALTGAKNNNL